MPFLPPAGVKTRRPLYRYDAGYPVSGVRSVERCRLVDTSCGKHYLFLQKRFSPCARLYRTDRIGGCRVWRWLLIYLNKIHEKGIATKHQKDLSFGMTVYAGLAGAVIGILQLVTYSSIS